MFVISLHCTAPLEQIDAHLAAHQTGVARCEFVQFVPALRAAALDAFAFD